MIDVLGEVVKWALIIYFFICFITVPFVWLLMVVEERRWQQEQRARYRSEEELGSALRHPVNRRVRGPRGPEDDPRWSAWHEQEDEQ